MILVDWFDAQACKGTELTEGWYWHEDDGEGIGGPYGSQEEAMERGLREKAGLAWGNKKAGDPAENVEGKTGVVSRSG